MRKTIKGIINEISENNKTMFSFEGFNTEKNEELNSELLYRIKRKYGNQNHSHNKRVEIAGKNINELKAYYMLLWGIDRYLEQREYLLYPNLDYVIKDYETRKKNALNILLGE